jgi:uncharacterized protein (DUF169 family)
MRRLSLDLSIFNKFDFKGPPVGVKFMFHKPEGIKRLDKNMAFCVMVKEAQERRAPFYADLENNACILAAYVWGYNLPKAVEGGYFGAALQAFKGAYASRRIYEVVPRLEKGTVNYITFYPLDKLSCDPDLLIIVTDDTSQAEVILRAMSYTTGKILSSKTTNVLGCAWLYAYPYLTGELNYITAGLGFGMRVNKAFPSGRQIISIPYDWLPTIVRNLQEMPWVPTSYLDESGEFDRKLFIEFGLDSFHLE